MIPDVLQPFCMHWFGSHGQYVGSKTKVVMPGTQLKAPNLTSLLLTMVLARRHAVSQPSQCAIWVVVKIMVPFWVP